MAPGTLAFTRALWRRGARLSLWFTLNLGESSRIYVSRLNQVYGNFARFMAHDTHAFTRVLRQFTLVV